MIPYERSLVKRLEGKPFALIGVNTDTNRDKLKERIAQSNVTWRSFFDPDGARIASTWGVFGFPSVFIIDHKGVIRFGPELTEAEIDKAIDQLLKEMEKEPPQ